MTSRFQICQFQIKFMTLCHAVQRNMATQGAYKACKASKEAVDSANN